MDHEQLQLGADLRAVMRAAVTRAVARGGHFVAPPDLLLGLLDDGAVGAALSELVAHERVARAAAAAPDKLPGVAEVADAPAADGAAPFPRYDTFAFHARDGVAARYLDADAYRIFVEGARRAGDVYHARHLAMGFAAEAVKDGDVLALFAAEPQAVSSAVYALEG